jgi:putative transcriptional regulator
MVRSILLLLLLGLAWPTFGADDDPATKPILLVARKNLPDPFFRESVVLVANYGAIGPVGVIVNRPTEVTLAKVFSDIEKLRTPQARLFFGGPVRPESVLVLFRAASAPPEATRILDGVYITSTPALLRKLLSGEVPADDLRVFGGHAGWGPGQLESEISRNDWHLIAVDAKTLFEKKPESLWPELERKASAIMAWLSSGSAHRERTPSRP